MAGEAGCLVEGARVRLDGDLGQDRELVVAALGDVGGHALGIDQPGLVDHEPRLDARGLLDELDGGGRQRLDLARGDGVGVRGVEPLDIGVEGLDQLGVREAVGRGVEPGGGDDRVCHGFLGARKRDCIARSAWRSRAPVVRVLHESHRLRRPQLRHRTGRASPRLKAIPIGTGRAVQDEYGVLPQK